MRALLLPSVIAAISLLGALDTEQARACSPAPCGGAPRVSIRPDEVVPANLGEVGVFRGPGGWGTVTLRLLDADQQGKALFSTVLPSSEPTPYVALDAALQAGKRYVLETSTDCGGHSDAPQQTARVAFASGPERTPPSTLGILLAQPVQIIERTLPTVSGSCVDEYRVGAVTLVLASMLDPLPEQPLLSSFELMVDGVPFSFHESQPAVFTAWMHCPDAADAGISFTSPGLSQGKHTAWVRARVADREPHYIESEHVALDLSCAEASDGGVVDAGLFEAGLPEAGLPEASLQQDAGLEPTEDEHSAGSSGEDTSSPQTAESRSGCEVARCGAGRSNLGALLLTVALLALFAFRARRASGTASDSSTERRP